MIWNAVFIHESALINTSIQRGGRVWRAHFNRFNGFSPVTQP